MHLKMNLLSRTFKDLKHLNEMLFNSLLKKNNKNLKLGT